MLFYSRNEFTAPIWGSDKEKHKSGATTEYRGIGDHTPRGETLIKKTRFHSKYNEVREPMTVR